MLRSLKKSCIRITVLTDEPFYVTKAVNEDLKNYVSNEVKKDKIMSYCMQCISVSHGCC